MFIPQWVSYIKCSIFLSKFALSLPLYERSTLKYFLNLKEKRNILDFFAVLYFRFIFHLFQFLNNLFCMDLLRPRDVDLFVNKKQTNKIIIISFDISAAVIGFCHVKWVENEFCFFFKSISPFLPFFFFFSYFYFPTNILSSDHSSLL